MAVSAFASKQLAKPIVSGFSHGNVENIVRVDPELVVTFSDAGRSAKKAEQRVVGIEEVVAANPQIILASWCGKPVDIGSVRAREGFEGIDAVRTGHIHELAPEIILQAGPDLVSGLAEIARIVREWAMKTP